MNEKQLEIAVKAAFHKRWPAVKVTSTPQGQILRGEHSNQISKAYQCVLHNEPGEGLDRFAWRLVKELDDRLTKKPRILSCWEQFVYVDTSGAANGRYTVTIQAQVLH